MLQLNEFYKQQFPVDFVFMKARLQLMNVPCTGRRVSKTKLFVSNYFFILKLFPFSSFLQPLKSVSLSELAETHLVVIESILPDAQNSEIGSAQFVQVKPVEEPYFCSLYFVISFFQSSARAPDYK